MTIDCAREFLKMAAVRGYPLTSTTNQLTSLLDDYGASLLEQAMLKPLRKNRHTQIPFELFAKILDERVEAPLVTFALSKDNVSLGWL